MPTFTNRLDHETSPYLKQHAHNPVDWFPWGPEALEKARQLDRPIFLSIGYSACHWCHVMEHESFENEEVAGVLNEHFISIKVDREERPDLDQIYMTSVQLLTGQGGWPMSVFLTPELKPFFGGTYFPPDDRYGRPGFKRLLLALADAWKNRRDEVTRQAGNITEHIQSVGSLPRQQGPLGPELIRSTVRQLERAFDGTHGGFGGAPKFPHAMDLRLLLRAWKRFGDDSALHMARLTLDKMARGGMYDHLGGGFHRYSTDARWLVPHFEKMLYDNALLTLAYLEAFQATGEPFYRQVVEETLDYVCREMTSPEGAFFSTQDADSEGVEGKFFVWSKPEVEAILGPDLAKVFGYVYDVTEDGNWEEHNILNRAKSDEQDARMLKLDVAELRPLLAEGRQKLLAVRGRRIWPGRDDKVLTAWNGLMIAAFAQAGAVLGRADYVDAAVRSAAFILQRMRGQDGRLQRTWFAGTEPKLNAYLEDYAFLIDALVSVYEATGTPGWLDDALKLTDIMIEQFWDEGDAGFFYTGKDHETLITRVKDLPDGSIPAGNSMAVTALLRLSHLTGRRDLADRAERSLSAAHGLLAKSPLAAGQLLIALDFLIGPVQEFAVLGQGDELERVLRALWSGFRPNKVVAVQRGEPASSVALLKDRPFQAPVTTYLCENFTCQAPWVGAAAAEDALRNANSP